MSCPLARSDQTAAEAAVASGVHGRNACGETPSTLALWPLTVTFPPSTGRTAVTPPSLLISASCAEVIPPGTAAIRSGTNACRDADSRFPADPEAPASWVGRGNESDATWEEGMPPALAAGTANPATL